MEKCREQHRPLYAPFNDLSKAFDSVDRDLLWLILERCGCFPRFVQLIKELHEGMTLRIKMDGNLRTIRGGAGSQAGVRSSAGTI